MKSRHTPGPWGRTTSGTFDKAGITAKVRGNIITLAICDTSHLRTAFMITGDSENARKWGGNIDEANAELMSLAPEMLESLKEIREWYVKNHAEYFGDATPVCFSKALSIIMRFE